MHERVPAPDDVERLGERRLEHVAEQERDRVVHPEPRGLFRGDRDHLLGQVDPRDLGPVGPGQVERGAADAAAHIEDAGPRP